MVFTPTRGDAPPRFGPDVPMIPDIGTGLLDTRDSSAYRRNILNNRECKITAFHRTIQALLDRQ